MSAISSSRAPEGLIQAGPNSRVLWIDFARIYATFFVIVRHIPKEYGDFAFLVDLFNYRGLIFVFFFLSGYFIHQRRLLESKVLLDTKRFMTLLKLYLFWAFIGFILIFPMIHLDALCAGDWSYLSFKSVLRGMGLYPAWPHNFPLNVPLWFLKVLMLLALVSPLLVRLSTRILIVLSVGCLACSDVLITVDVLEHTQNFSIGMIPFRSFETAMALGFYCIGIIVKRHFSMEEFTGFVTRNAWLPLLLSILLFPMVRIWGFMPPCRSSMLVMLSVLTILSMGPMCERIFPRIFRFIASFGEGAFFVYVTHCIMVEYLEKVFLPSHNTPAWHHLVTYAGPFVIAAICLALFTILKRYAPGFMATFALVKPKR